MAIDTVAACAAAASGPQTFFVVITILFAFYVLSDTLIAALVIRRALDAHLTSSPDNVKVVDVFKT